MSQFYYVTVGTGKEFLGTYTRWALRSLLKSDVPPMDIHFVGMTKKDILCIRKMVPEISNLYLVNEDLSYVKWKYHGGKRKYSLFKAAALYKTFPNPIENKSADIKL